MVSALVNKLQQDAANHKKLGERDVELLLTITAHLSETQRLLEEALDRYAAQGEELARTIEQLRVEAEDRLVMMEGIHFQEDQLVHQNRLASMGEMISNIAHQWRQPLNTLALMVQSLPLELEAGHLTAEVLQTHTARAMKVISHMSRTIEDFREFFRSDKPQAAFDVGESVRATLAILEAVMKEQSVRVDVSVAEKTLANGFPNEFTQVLVNIIVNACQALRDRKVDKPEILLKVFRENGKAVVTIADNAGGIAEDVMDRVFDANFTTKGHKGTGIGLSMSKIIIERHMHGRLTFRNIDRGAEFRVEVEAKEEPGSPAAV